MKQSSSTEPLGIVPRMYGCRFERLGPRCSLAERHRQPAMAFWRHCSLLAATPAQVARGFELPPNEKLQRSTPFVPPTYCRGRANTKRNLWYPRIVSELKACEVSYRDYLGVKHSVEVTAQSLYESAALGSKLLKVSSLHHVTFEVRSGNRKRSRKFQGRCLLGGSRGQGGIRNSRY